MILRVVQAFRNVNLRRRRSIWKTEKAKAGVRLTGWPAFRHYAADHGAREFSCLA